MEKIAAQVYYWLMNNNLNPKKIKVILRADDEYTLFQLRAAVMRETNSHLTAPPKPDALLRHMKIHGVAISLSHL